MEGADNGPYEQDDGTYICQGCYEHLVSKFDLDNYKDSDPWLLEDTEED